MGNAVLVTTRQYHEKHLRAIFLTATELGIQGTCIASANEQVLDLHALAVYSLHDYDVGFSERTGTTRCIVDEQPRDEVLGAHPCTLPSE
jgi:hypothetical protein